MGWRKTHRLSDNRKTAHFHKTRILFFQAGGPRLFYTFYLDRGRKNRPWKSKIFASTKLSNRKLRFFAKAQND